MKYGEYVIWSLILIVVALWSLWALPGHAQENMPCVMVPLSVVEAAMQDNYGEVRHFQHVFADGSMHTWLLNAATETWSILATAGDDTLTCLYSRGVGIENMPDRELYEKVGTRS